jgi:Propionyl-coenzyme A carboxylase BT domain
VRVSLVIAMAVIGAAAGCGSGSGGQNTRVAIHAVVRAGCAAGPATAGRPYPGSIVVRGAGTTKVVKIRGRGVARVAVDGGSYRAGAAWVAGSRLVSAQVDGRPVTVAPNGQVRFTAPAGANTDLRLVVGVRRTECTPPGAAG